MNATSIAAKGVRSRSSEPAVLHGWQLVFNVADFFSIEGGTGNIEPNENAQVHGILHECDDSDLEKLDELEAYGVCYDRREVSITTYQGRQVKAFAYVGLPSRVENGLQPSQRYLSILINGAKAGRISEAYVDALNRIEAKPEPAYYPFNPPATGNKTYSSTDVQASKNLTVMAGMVFDMSQARKEHDYLKHFFAGRDVTLFFLKRMDTATGEESFDRVRKNILSNRQKKYLNSYLREFNKEYQLVGRVDYELDLNLRSHQPAIGQCHRRRGEDIAPSRDILEAAKRRNLELGHENLGPLSEEVGFIPTVPPMTKLPAGFEAWDETATNLPQLYSDLSLRRHIDSLPLMPTDPQSLPDAYLMRAAMVCAMLSHAYYYVDVETPKNGFPAMLTKPWQTIRDRLGRPDEVLSYIDLIVYNWRQRDPALAQPFLVENLDLLISTVSNQEERHFYLTQTEILARLGPSMGAIVRAQDAIINNEPQLLIHELGCIVSYLQQVVDESLLKINPNPHSADHVHPIVWAKTVAPFAVPIEQGIQGPSGTSSPIFNLFDTFLGRQSYQTFLGKEIMLLRSGYPIQWRQFLDAVGKVSLSTYVERSGDSELRGVFKELVESYAGTNGFLGRHRMKVYGYLELAFKVGRNVTIGGFSGLFKDRTWDQVDSELEYSRTERLGAFPLSCHHAHVQSVGQTHQDGPDGVKHIVLDVSQTGITYQPGDRCGILPENSVRLIHRTLKVLEAVGDEPIHLTEEWKDAINLRFGYENRSTITLAELLRFGKIRPVDLRIAESLHALSQDRSILEAIRDQSTARWELWDLLEKLADDGVDPKQLWQSPPDASTYIARIIPPEHFRMYSIASVMDPDQDTATEIQLIVGKVQYRSANAEEPSVLRHGTASNFLANSIGRKEPISIVIEHPPRFSLPKDPKTPVIMIAGGTGMSPFRGFIGARSQQQGAGPMWFILSLTSQDYFYYHADLIPLLAAGKLDLDMVFTRQDIELEFKRENDDFGTFVSKAGKRRYISDLLGDKNIREKLRHMLRSPEQGGLGAHIYICGRTSFARSVHNSIRELIQDSCEGSEQQRRESAENVLAKLVGEDRYKMEVFSSSLPSESPRQVIDVSTIVEHNNPRNGYWMIIDYLVYDITDYLILHPGGNKVLMGYAGMDATNGFMRVHKGRTEIASIRDVFEIGVVRSLRLDGPKATVKHGRGGSQLTALATFYRVWMQATYLIVEMENAFTNDLTLQEAPVIGNEPAGQPSAYRLQKAIESLERFFHSYVENLMKDTLVVLHRFVEGFCPPDSPTAGLDFEKLSDHYTNRPEYQTVIRTFPSIYRDIRDGDSLELHQQLFEICALRCQSLIAQLKQELVAGLKLFEQHEAKTCTACGQQLRGIFFRLPSHINLWLQSTAGDMSQNPFAADSVPVRAGQRPRPSEEFTIIAENDLWTVEEYAESKYVYVRRSPHQNFSIAELKAANQQLIEAIKHDHQTFGVVVDMRQATGRNDAEFESAMRDMRQALYDGFGRVAVLIASAIGQLQVSRIGRSEHEQTFITQDESAAVRFAMGENRDLPTDRKKGA